MNMNSIINMVIRRVVNIAINKGIDAGAQAFAKNKPGARGDGQPQDPQMEAAQRAEASQTARRLKQTARMTRRIGRF